MSLLSDPSMVMLGLSEVNDAADVAPSNFVPTVMKGTMVLLEPKSIMSLVNSTVVDVVRF